MHLLSISEIAVDQAKNYAAEDADITYRLWEIMRVLLIKNSLYDFYFYIEKPLIKVIAEMEISGCKIDNTKLTKLSKAQADYIGVDSQGPFKTDSYRY